MTTPIRYGDPPAETNSFILDDIEGSLVVTYDNKGTPKGTRKFRALFDDIADITKAVLGYVEADGTVHNPDFFPAVGTNLVCESIQWEPFGRMSKNNEVKNISGTLTGATNANLPLPAYSHAVGTATYVPQQFGFVPSGEGAGTTVPINLYEETIAGKEEVIPIYGGTNSALAWSSDGAIRTERKAAIAQIVSKGLDIRMVFKRRQSINTALIANMGKVNNAYIMMRTTGLCFPAESLLMGAPVFTRVSDSSGAYYDITVNLEYKETAGTVVATSIPGTAPAIVGGWNQYFNENFFDDTTKKFYPGKLYSNRNTAGERGGTWTEVKTYEPTSFSFLTTI